jgi:hypothetical protein
MDAMCLPAVPSDMDAMCLPAVPRDMGARCLLCPATDRPTPARPTPKIFSRLSSPISIVFCPSTMPNIFPTHSLFFLAPLPFFLIFFYFFYYLFIYSLENY